jgi:hypothetical protein
MTAMTVKLTFRFPAWDEKDGILFEVNADTKRDALKKARRMADNAGHLCALPLVDYSFSVVDTANAR